MITDKFFDAGNPVVVYVGKPEDAIVEILVGDNYVPVDYPVEQEKAEGDK